MKKISLVFTLLFVVLAAGSALAAGLLVKDKSKSFAPIQSISGLAPDPAASDCTTATGTKGTIVTVNTTGYRGLKWAAVTTATGAAAVVKRSVNANTAYMPESSGTVTISNDITSMKFDKYSTASSTTLTVCRELQ